MLLFRRELKKSEHVPIGLINASWGGANIRTWMSESAIQKIGGHDADLAVLGHYKRDLAAATQRWGQMWEAWWSAHAPAAPAPWSETFDASDWARAGGLGYWENWTIPGMTAFTVSSGTAQP